MPSPVKYTPKNHLGTFLERWVSGQLLVASGNKLRFSTVENVRHEDWDALTVITKAAGTTLLGVRIHQSSNIYLVRDLPVYGARAQNKLIGIMQAAGYRPTGHQATLPVVKDEYGRAGAKMFAWAIGASGGGTNGQSEQTSGHDGTPGSVQYRADHDSEVAG